MSIAEPLIFTEAAAKKVKVLIDETLLEEGREADLKLRVFVTGGGCSGFQYGFSFDEQLAADDTVVTRKVDDQPVSLVVDAMSLGYLQGAEIDYREDIEGAQFIIRNPNATTTCGCGSSFAVAD